MEDKNKKPTPFDNLFATLYLDNRASKREVELAYETLTKKSNNVPNSILQDYKLAYETLMTQWFCEKDENSEQLPNKEDFMTEDEHFKNINNEIVDEIRPKSLSNRIKRASKELKNKYNWSEKARALLTTQHINLTLFFTNIEKNCHKLFGRRFWTSEDMHKIMTDSTLTPLEFTNIYWEASFKKANITNEGNEEVRKELYKYFKNLKKYFTKTDTLCKEYTFDRTPFGVTGFCIMEADLAQHFVDMLIAKAKISGSTYSISSDIDLEIEIEEF